MPNHVHAIVVVTDGGDHRPGTACRAPTSPEQFSQPVRGSIATIVRSFKSAVTRRVNAIHGTPGDGLWQRRYYEHVIRDEVELRRIRDYVDTNPREWEFDQENPHGSATDKPHTQTSNPSWRSGDGDHCRGTACRARPPQSDESVSGDAPSAQQPKANGARVDRRETACHIPRLTRTGTAIAGSFAFITHCSFLPSLLTFPNAQLDMSIVMPNHVHAIVVVTDGGDHRPGTACRAPTSPEQFGRPVRGSIATIVRSFKSAVTRRVNEIHGTPGDGLWQRGYYEHVIRDEAELRRIRDYVDTNPQEWKFDQENPHGSTTDKPHTQTSELS